ncbi:hypothetical protein PILCRDRAFT_816668 [Piloderma croceum F 1598]|uniref:Nuclear condensin complex subunit 3 C-terminal domain-containing protein n=1 Tax=Piloderma croceum (strain F 1598) TaxID=765440 RepID=A0A0C3FPU0_PILCF|nr:hypothetical protein PILCRDRAFT_816668 [Piloderma croceum F 1598]
MAPCPSDSAIFESLSYRVSEIFDQAQSSAANHRKNCITLHNLHARAASITQVVNDGDHSIIAGENCFGDAFLDMVNRILIVKKGPAVADRIVKFIGGYVKYMNEKVSEQIASGSTVASTSSHVDVRSDDDTPASRFVARLLKWLFRGFLSKNKTVRFRSVSIVSEIVSYLGEINEDMYVALRNGLAERANDKESIVRSYAVIALCKLISTEDPDDLEFGEQSISEIIMDSLCLDPAVEVRRAALVNIPSSPQTLPTILSRGRDVDPVMRKLLYSSVLLTKLEDPKHLTIAQRERVVKDGLGDRESSVRVAAGKVVEAWFEGIVSEGSGDGTVTGDIVGFLQLFDIVESGAGAAADALQSLFVTRRGVLDEIAFNDSFWNELTAESALLVRVFVDHCLSRKGEPSLDAVSLPVVTAFAFHIQEVYNVFLELADENNMFEAAAGEDVDEQERDRVEEEMAQAAFVLCELLKVAVHLDYTDEIGRRKLSVVLRNMLAQEELPESLTGPCLDVLKVVIPDERELVRVVVEIVHELMDWANTAEETAFTQQSQDDEIRLYSSQHTIRKDRTWQRTKQREDMTPEERARADILDMRGLVLCTGMFERIHGNFEENSTLEGVLGDFIIPAVKRKELAMREKGLVGLGLCCLVAKNMALSSFQLFLSQVQTAPDELKLKVLQVIFDMLMVYDQEFFGRSDEIAERIITFLLQTLETEESKTVQAVLCFGVSKLLLCGFVTDERVLTSLLMAYVSPVTADNQELRQCLSHFFPLYSYASLANQSRMRSIFMPAYDLVTRVHRELEANQEMILPYQFGQLLIDWTNPQKAAEERPSDNSAPGSHVDVAVCILRSLYEPERDDEDRKTLCQLLGDLHIPNNPAPLSLMQLKILLSHLQKQCPFDDVSTDRMVNRFKNRLWKKFSLDADNIDEEQCIYYDDIRELYQFIGVLVPVQNDVASRVPSPTVNARPKHPNPRNLATAESSDDQDASPSSGHHSQPCSSSSKSQRARGNASASSRLKGETGSTPVRKGHEDKENVKEAVSMTSKNRSRRLRGSRSTSVLVSSLPDGRSRTLSSQ